MLERTSEARLRLWWWLGCLSLSAGGANYALIKSMNQDVAYYVNAVERLLHGAHLYRDLIDVNVPTIYGVMALPVWLGLHLGVAPPLAFNVFVLLLAVLSTSAAFHAARRVLPHSALLPDVLAGILLLGFVVLPGFHFGQREHLAAMGMAPYAVVRAGLCTARPNRGFRAAVGLASGIGVALKPYFGLIALGMEAALILRRGRGWRPGLECVLLGLAGSLCAVVTMVFFPEYFEHIVPLARTVYASFEGPVLLTILADSAPRLFVYSPMLVLATLLATGLTPRTRDLIFILTGGALGGFVAYFLQAKGWAYQMLPALIFSITSFALALAARVRGEGLVPCPSRLFAAGVSGLAVLAFAGFTLDLVGDYRSNAVLRTFFASTVTTLRDYARGGPALFVSIDLSYTFPGINYAGAVYPYRWHHLLPLPGLYRDFKPGPQHRFFRTPEEMNAIERDFFESFVDDALKFPPRIIMVNRRRAVRAGLAPDFDLFAYFCQSARFADLMRDYEWLDHRGYYDVLVPREKPTDDAGPCGMPSTNIDTNPSS
jgi:hypothetical protein